MQIVYINEPTNYATNQLKNNYNFIVTTGSVKFTMRTSRGIWYHVEMSPNLTEKNGNRWALLFLGQAMKRRWRCRVIFRAVMVIIL